MSISLRMNLSYLFIYLNLQTVNVKLTVLVILKNKHFLE